MTNTEHDQLTGSARVSVKMLDAIGWGIFFIWMGIVFLINIGWGAGFLGVGVITLGGQVARRYFGLPIERFGLLVGIIFAIGGFLKVLNIQLSEAPLPAGLLPILSIMAGIALVVSTLRRKP